MRFLLGEAWGNLLFMIFILMFIGIVFPILDSYLYQKFKIMSYTNEELKKENDCIRKYLKEEMMKNKTEKKL